MKRKRGKNKSVFCNMQLINILQFKNHYYNQLRRNKNKVISQNYTISHSLNLSNFYQIIHITTDNCNN